MRTRAERRAAAAIERRTRASGRWQPWVRTETPGGYGTGWCREVTHAFANVAYAVLVRPIDMPDGPGFHLAIRTPTNAEPPWRDLQRIKNELFGEEALGFQVYPPESRLVDAADMYHLWIMPAGHLPGFGLHPADHA